MILEQETYEQFGYYPSELTPQSHKKTIAACDDCGKVRIIQKKQYRSLCGSCAHKGEKNYMFDTHRKSEENPMFGKHHSEEARRKQLEAKKGKYIGEKNPAWKGGLSFGKYCPKFNDEFKERVRILFDRRCFECGKTEEESGRKLDVHHVNYNKMVCCNDVEPLFVALCRRCHSKTQNSRETWEAHFSEKLLAEHNGKCFYTREEVHNSLLRWAIF